MSGNKARHTANNHSRVSYSNPRAYRRGDRANVLCRPGGPSGGIPPDPIPNSAVKASSAHGTAAQAAGESVAARSAKNVCKPKCESAWENEEQDRYPAITNNEEPRERNLAGLFVLRDTAPAHRGPRDDRY